MVRKNFAINLFFFFIFSVITLYSYYDVDFAGISSQCKFAALNDSTYSLLNCGVSVPSSKLIIKINDFFSNKFINVTNLTITNSNIKSIPSIITKMINLKFLDLSFNRIEILEDGIFDNIKFLTNLHLKNNKIFEIGDNTFSNESTLLYLTQLGLSNNRLEKVDSWPLIRVLTVNNSFIDLSYNLIKNFTHKKNWTLPCHKTYNRTFNINLEANRIEHVLSISQMFPKSIFEFFKCRSLGQTSYYGININNNPIICDCYEFKVLRFYIIVHDISEYLLELKCNNGKRYSSMPLEDLVCNVPCVNNKCRCIQQPSTATFHVQCSNSSIFALPDSLPPTNRPSRNFARYKLDFSWNIILNLSTPSYLFNKTRLLNLTYSKLTTITDKFWLAIKNIDYLYLNNNNITTLPYLVKKEFGNFRSISLSDNPFSCGCSDRWLQGWIRETRDRISDAEAMNCASPPWLKGRIILTIQEPEFCTDPILASRKKILLYTYAIVAVTSAAILAIFMIFLFYRWRHWVFSKFKFHPFEKDECENEMMQFDAFISSAKEDILEAKSIVHILEELNFKICFHERDFMPGVIILDNIKMAINESKRCIFFVSQNFFSSVYCNMEFEFARLRDLTSKRNRVIVWTLCDQDEIQAADEIIKDILRDYLLTHTYINYPKIGWDNAINQLLYSMPQRKLGHADSQLLRMIDTEDHDSLII